MSPHLSQLNVATAHSLIGIILGEIIWESSTWQHINRFKITILGANWQLFRLERIAKCLYFVLSKQNIKFHWIVMKIKKFLLPIWWYNRDLFPHSNKYNVVFVLNGLKPSNIKFHIIISTKLHSLNFLQGVSWEPEGHYRHSLCTAIAPFWFSSEAVMNLSISTNLFVE